MFYYCFYPKQNKNRNNYKAEYYVNCKSFSNILGYTLLAIYGCTTYEDLIYYLYCKHL